MVIDNDEIYQIIVTKIFQKNKHILYLPYNGKTGIEALINTIENRTGYPSFINQYATYGWDFMQEMKLLEYLKSNIVASISLVHLLLLKTRKIKKLSRSFRLYKPVTMHYIQLITSKD
jgi:hypothetical protein